MSYGITHKKKDGDLQYAPFFAVFAVFVIFMFSMVSISKGCASNANLEARCLEAANTDTYMDACSDIYIGTDKHSEDEINNAEEDDGATIVDIYNGADALGVFD